jgi:alkylated DNA repair dioxygenase AlkB
MAPLDLFENGDPQGLLPPGKSSAIYLPSFLDDDEATIIFEKLNSETQWLQPDIKMFGKKSKLPREVSWVADAENTYRYSGITSTPQPWTQLLEQLRLRISEAAGTAFNSVLLNRYRDGNDTVAWHSDDEPELGFMPTIASLSLGADRRFQLRSKETRETIEKRLAHGSLLIMSGDCQKDWIHQIPRERRVLSPRINLTFRQVRA